MFFSADLKESGGAFCANLHECFVSTLTLGLRTGSQMSILESASSHFYWRFGFDIAFWIIISVISMNLILGPSLRAPLRV